MVCFHLILNFKFASSRVLAPADRCAEVAQGDFPGQTDRGGAPWSYRYYCYSSWRSLGAEATRSVLPSLRRLQEWPVKQLLLQPSVLSPTLHPPSSSSPPTSSHHWLQTSHRLLRRFFFPAVETTATTTVALPTVAFLRKALIWLQLFQMLWIAQETWAVAASDASYMTQPTAAADAQPESVQNSPQQSSIWPGGNTSPGHDRWCPCMAACLRSSHLWVRLGDLPSSSTAA